MGHEYQDAVSLEIAKRIAAELPSRPEWLDLARTNLRNWMGRNRDAGALMRCYREWLAILDRPVDEICGLLISQTDEGQRLRQNSPFAGALPPQEVWKIKVELRRETRAS